MKESERGEGRERKSDGRKCSIDTIEREMKAQLYRWKSIVGKRFAHSREKREIEGGRKRETDENANYVAIGSSAHMCAIARSFNGPHNARPYPIENQAFDSAERCTTIYRELKPRFYLNQRGGAESTWGP